MNQLEKQRAADFPASVFQALEDRLMANMIRHCRDYGQPIATDEWLMKKLAEIGRLNQENIDIIAKATGSSWAAMERMLNEAAERTLEEVEPAMRKVVRAGLAGEAVPAKKSRNVAQVMDVIRKQAKDTLNVCNTTMLYKARDAYRAFVSGLASAANEIAGKQDFIDVLNRNATAALIGAESRQQALRKCIKEFTKRGIPAFVDKRGREWTPEAYVNMAMRSTSNTMAAEIQMARADDHKIHLVQVDSHAGARPKCARDQGKIFDRSNQSDQYPHWSTSSYGQPDGLLGINCGHHIFPFIEEVNIRRYFPTEDLEANDRLYRKIQVQRALERDVRKQKRECMLYDQIGDRDGFEAAAVKLKRKEAKLKAYVDGDEQMHRRRDREQVVGFDRSISARAVMVNNHYQKILAEKVRNDKIIAEIRTLGIRGEINLCSKPPDIEELSFDDVHINQERNHGVTEDEAKSYIKNARFSVTRWKGKFTNYYSDDGAAYVDNESKSIRTAFKRRQYDDAIQKAMEVMNHG